MGARGRKAVLERYTWDRVVDQYEALFHETVETAARLRSK
jgi:hypothetical protein